MSALARRIALFLLATCVCAPALAAAQAHSLNVSDFGARPDSQQDSTPAVEAALIALQKTHASTLEFPKGRYDFWPGHAVHRHYFISNHDPVDQRPVLLHLESAHNLTVDGHGSTFVFHGMLLPIAVTASSGVLVKNLVLEVATQHELSGTVLAASNESTDVRLDGEGTFDVKDDHLWIVGEDFRSKASASLLFDHQRREMAWHTGDDWDTAGTQVKRLDTHTLRFYHLHQPAKPGQELVLWSGDRPNPAIFVNESSRVSITNVTVHSAQGMGFVAQRSAGIRLDRFRVALAPGSTKYVTTVADAVHFSNCRGDIAVVNGLYENMLDDALNVHGSYIKVVDHPAADTVLLRFGHPQSFGFKFASAGDRLQFVDAVSLAPRAEATVQSVERVDDRQFRVRLRGPLAPAAFSAGAVMNLTWQPKLLYRNNHIRHNRARGILIGTIGGTLVEDNVFDHLAGPAILMSADANFWYESAPAQHVTIRRNRFVDTNIADFGPATIWIDPPPEKATSGGPYSVRDIRITGNQFTVFQKPLLYASHTMNLWFTGNKVQLDSDYPEHTGTDSAVVSLRDVRCANLRNNTYSFTPEPGDWKLQGSSVLRDVGSGNGSLHNRGQDCTSLPVLSRND